MLRGGPRTPSAAGFWGWLFLLVMAGDSAERLLYNLSRWTRWLGASPTLSGMKAADPSRQALLTPGSSES